MATKKFDGVIEAVRYAPNGKIELVRAYERRGATFSDHVLLSRNTLVERLQKGKRFVIGQRKELWASTFSVSDEIRYTAVKDVIANSQNVDHDSLNAPVF
jgi:hypothetical protein